MLETNEQPAMNTPRLSSPLLITQSTFVVFRFACKHHPRWLHAQQFIATMTAQTCNAAAADSVEACSQCYYLTTRTVPCESLILRTTCNVCMRYHCARRVTGSPVAANPCGEGSGRNTVMGVWSAWSSEPFGVNTFLPQDASEMPPLLLAFSVDRVVKNTGAAHLIQRDMILIYSAVTIRALTVKQSRYGAALCRYLIYSNSRRRRPVCLAPYPSMVKGPVLTAIAGPTHDKSSHTLPCYTACSRRRSGSNSVTVRHAYLR